MGFRTAEMCALLCYPHRLGMGFCYYSIFQSCLQWWAWSFCKFKFSSLVLSIAQSGGFETLRLLCMVIIQVYLTDLMSRESLLICSEDGPILSLALQGEDWLWIATSDSSLHKWPTKERSSSKHLSKASSFLAGTLPFARARACLESSPSVSMFPLSITICRFAFSEGWQKKQESPCFLSTMCSIINVIHVSRFPYIQNLHALYQEYLELSSTQFSMISAMS